VRVLRQLPAREPVRWRDLRTVLRSVADAAARSKDTSYLVENVRRRLFRQVTSRVADSKGVVHALTLDRPSEEQLRRTLGQSDGEATLAPDVATARRLVTSLEGANLAHGRGGPADRDRGAVRSCAARCSISPPGRPRSVRGHRARAGPRHRRDPAGTIDLSPQPWSNAA